MLLGVSSILLIASNNVAAKAKILKSERGNHLRAADFDSKRMSLDLKRNNFKLELNKLKKIKREKVPKSVPLINGGTVFELRLRGSSAEQAIFELDSESRKVKYALVSGGGYDIDAETILPETLYVQYDPMWNMGLRVTWAQGSGFWYGLRLRVDGVPVEENPPLIFDDPEFIYFGQGAGFSFEPSVDGEYYFELIVFNEHYNEIDFLSAEPLVILPEQYIFGPPYVPNPILVDELSIPFYDPDPNVSTELDYIPEAQVILRWDILDGIWYGYNLHEVYPDVTYFEMRTEYNTNGFSDWQNIGYVGWLPLDNLEIGFYDVQIRACNEYGCSQQVSASFEIPDDSLPSAPYLYDNYDGLIGNEFQLYWVIPPGFEGYIYHIEESTDRENWVQIAVTSENRLNLEREGGQYYYRAKSCENGICGKYGNVNSIEVIPDNAFTNKKVIYIHTDLLGSPIAETNENGEIN